MAILGRRLRRVPMVGVLALSACTTGPNYTPPPAPVAMRYTTAPLDNLATELGEDANAARDADAPWWQALAAPQLDATLREALANNRGLQAQRARLAAADEQIGIAGAALYPRVDLDASAGRVKYGAAFLGPQKLPPFSFYSIGPAVSYAFDYTGGIHRAIEQRRAAAVGAEEELQAARLSLTGNVAMQALAAAAARAQLQTLAAVLDDDRRNLQLVQDAFEAGGASRVDVLNAQSQLSNDQTALPPVRRALSGAEHALALLVGRSSADWSAPQFGLEDFTLPEQLPLVVPSELVRRRPDIRAAEAQLHATTAAVGVAGANLYPQITLSANASLQSVTVHSLFDASAAAAGLTGNLVAPLFNHGQLRAQQRAAVDAMHATLDDYEQVVLRAFDEVADALEALDQDADLLRSEQQAVAVSTQNLELTRESFGAGNTGVLQVLEAERQNQQARLGLVRTEAQQLQDTVQLLLALGGRLPPA